MSKVLITGGAGFIGSNFVHYLRKLRPEDELFVVDALTYAGNLANLKALEEDPKFHFIPLDIRNSTALQALFVLENFDEVVNFAAESHVDRSLVDAQLFLTTNIIGTQNLLDAAKNIWKLEPDNRHDKRYRPGVKFLQVSTDEVYGDLGATGFFTEDSPLKPNNPYAASKTAADLLVHAAHHSFAFPANITRCSNNYGPYQFPEKLIPLMINNCQQDKELPVYGDGMQIRDWLYVEDHCSALATVLHSAPAGEVYNIGGNNEKANIEIVKLILATMGKPESLIRYVTDRPGHDRRYAIDNTKITSSLGWKPAYTFTEGMQKTIAWYLANQDWLSNVISGDYSKYYEEMYGAN